MVRFSWRRGSGRSQGGADEVLHELGQLWPCADLRVSMPPWPDRTANRVRAGGDFWVLPTIRRPRLLVPADPKIAPYAFQALRRPTSRQGAVVDAALRWILRAGGARLWPPRLTLSESRPATQSIVDYLSVVFRRQVAVAVVLGPPRANRKPVLAVLDGRGSVLGFVKVGVNALTRSLVSTEAQNLHLLQRVNWRRLEVPQLLSHDRWNGLEVLVQSALPSWRAPLDHSVPLRREAMAEVARAFGTEQKPLETSTYLDRLRGRLDAMPDSTVAGLGQQVLSTFHRSDASAVVTFGTWHGDWSHWNMAVSQGKVMLWDWERMERDVPVGFDAFHLAFREVRQRTRDSAESGVAFLESAGGVGRDFGIPVELSRPLAMLYLIEVGLRYLNDGWERNSPRTEAVRAWLLPAMRHYLWTASSGESGSRPAGYAGDTATS